MMTDEQTARMRAHRNNIYRYRHLLQTKLTELERDFIEKRNSSFGRRGYDLRQAMEDRLEKLNTIARQ